LCSLKEGGRLRGKHERNGNGAVNLSMQEEKELIEKTENKKEELMDLIRYSYLGL